MMCSDGSIAATTELARSLDALNAMIRSAQPGNGFDEPPVAHGVRSGLQRLARAACTAGFPSYSSVALRVLERFEPAVRTAGLLESQVAYLQRWIRISRRYFAAREDFRHAADLVNLLALGPTPEVGAEERIELLSGLLAEAVRIESQTQPARVPEICAVSESINDDAACEHDADSMAADACRVEESRAAVGRGELERHLDQILASAPNAPLAVLAVGVQGIEPILTSFGPDVAEAVLAHVATQIAACAGVSGMCARSGDHRFLMIKPDCSAEEISAQAERLIEFIGRPHPLEAHTVAVSARIGVAMHPNGGNGAAELLRNADAALHHADTCARRPLQFFAVHMRQAALRRVSMEAQLRHALETESFELRYQPKVALASGTLSGVEALLRWRCGARGLILPAEFIPIAEETGLIVPLGEWVIESACAELSRWREQFDQVPPIAVNLSPAQLASHRTVERILAALDRHAVSPELLEFEITETAVMQDDAQILGSLAELARLGVPLALDDFGVGYSNLARLGQLPLTALKLDRSLVAGVATHSRDAKLVRAIIDIGHTLGMSVVAEGVQTPGQLEALRAAGCDEGQGYLFARALAVDQLREWLQRPSQAIRAA